MNSVNGIAGIFGIWHGLTGNKEQKTMDERLQKIVDGIKDGSIPAKMGELLNCYYDKYIEGLIEDQLRNEPPESKRSKYDFPRELTLPLEERSGGIAEALERCVSLGVNMNENDYDDPLMKSVAWADAPVTEFLIRHGSDPFIWPFMEEAYEELPVVNNYYYEDIDIAWLDEHWNYSEEYGRALLHTAKVLATVGHLGPWGGFCLEIDENNMTSLHGAQYRY